jgi:DNA gyrase/topoisomerase IV subunit A
VFHCCFVQSSKLTQREKESSANVADLKEQLEGLRNELANSKSLSDSLKQELEQVRERRERGRERGCPYMYIVEPRLVDTPEKHTFTIMRTPCLVQNAISIDLHVH